MKRFNRPTTTGGSSYARYAYKWSQIGLRISTKHLAFAGLKALYGVRAAEAAIREARRVSRKKR